MDLPIVIERYAGFIFDCDGTLADSMPAHFIAWNHALKACGADFTFPEEDFYRLGGMPSREIVGLLNERHGANLRADAVADAKEAGYLAALEQVRPIEAVVALVHRAAAAGKPVSVASGGARRVVLKTLAAIGLDSRFPVVVTADDVSRHKPAPDVFLLAAERMGVPPEQCLVLEDTDLGKQAATSAGMDCYLVPPPS